MRAPTRTNYRALATAAVGHFFDAVTADTDWLCQVSGIDPSMASALAPYGSSCWLETADWRVSYRNVPLRHFVAIEACVTASGARSVSARMRCRIGS